MDWDWPGSRQGETVGMIARTAGRKTDTTTTNRRSGTKTSIVGWDRPPTRRQGSSGRTRHNERACRDDARLGTIAKKAAWDPASQTCRLVGSAREMATSNRCCKVGLGRDASGRAMCCPKMLAAGGIIFWRGLPPQQGQLGHGWPVRLSRLHLSLRDGKERWQIAVP